MTLLQRALSELQIIRQMGIFATEGQRDRLDVLLPELQKAANKAADERDARFGLELAAYLAFIRGKDIDNTIEAARAALVERALRAEARAEAAQELEAKPDAVLLAMAEAIHVLLLNNQGADHISKALAEAIAAVKGGAGAL